MKKEYRKPETKIVLTPIHHCLLAGSYQMYSTPATEEENDL